MAVVYEWFVETLVPLELNDDPSIRDISDVHTGMKTLAEARKLAASLSEEHMIALVRFHETARYYAYLNDSLLPEWFIDGPKVPKRFHDEVARTPKLTVKQ